MSIKSAACAVAICLASSAALAQPAPLPAGPRAGLAPVMPPQQIGKILRVDGFVPQATPVRVGEAYQVRAIDRYGRQVRVAIDARYGDILMVRPIVMAPAGAYGPRPYGVPPGYYNDDMPTGAIGANPPPPSRAAALTPARPPIPRPKPPSSPAAAAPTPPPAPNPAPADAGAAAAAPTKASPPAPAAPSAPATAAPAALPPVTPLE